MRYVIMNMNQRANSVMTSSRKMIGKRRMMKVAGLSVLAAAGIGFSLNVEAADCRTGGGSEGREKPDHVAARGIEGAEEKGAHWKENCPLRGIDDAVGSALDSLDSARAALKDDDAENASEEIDAAIERLEGVKEKVAEHCPAKADARPVNTKCPMMGSDIEPDEVSDDLKLTFQGETVGFCCPPCLGAWENLSDEEKAEKLGKARENPKGRGHGGHESDHDHGDHEPDHGQGSCH